MWPCSWFRKRFKKKRLEMYERFREERVDFTIPEEEWTHVKSTVVGVDVTPDFGLDPKEE